MATDDDQNSSTAGAPQVTRKSSSPGEEISPGGQKPVMKLGKRILAICAAIGTIGAAIGYVTGAIHSIGGHGHKNPPVTQVEVSPVLGISFRQDGRLDPMSLSGAGLDQVVHVAMAAGPFELWFPTLTGNQVLEVCTSSSSSVFASVAKTATPRVQTCLSPGTGGSDDNHGSGELPLTSSSYRVSGVIVGTRAQAASAGEEKFYVSSLANPFHEIKRPGPLDLTKRRGLLYLVAYLDESNGFRYNPSNVEDFVLNLS